MNIAELGPHMITYTVALRKRGSTEEPRSYSLTDTAKGGTPTDSEMKSLVTPWIATVMKQDGFDEVESLLVTESRTRALPSLFFPEAFEGRPKAA